MSGHSYESLSALVLGFALAGVLSSGWEALARRPLGLVSLQTGDWQALMGVPVVVLSAPILILRAALGGPRERTGRFATALVATVVAGGWSLVCGRLVFDIARTVAGA